MNRSAQLICAWALPVFAVMFAIGFVGLMGYVPPWSPALGAPEIAHLFQENVFQVRLGLVVSSYAVMLLVPWGVVLAVQSARSEQGFPVLAIVQIAAVTVGAFTGLLCMSAWAVATFRPFETDPQILRMLNDTAWILFIWTIPTFSLWEGALGLSILLDKRASPTFPRWSGYFSIWLPFVSSISSVVVFFRGGVFGWSGLPFWMALGMFFVWVVPMHVLLIDAIGKQSRDDGHDEVKSRDGERKVVDEESLTVA